MPVEKISHEESLFEGTEKLNASIEQSNDAIKEATTAKSTANQAVSTSQEAVTKAESVQAQFNAVVVEGDSSPAADQARLDAENVLHPTLKARADSDYNKVTAQLADKASMKGDNTFTNQGDNSTVGYLTFPTGTDLTLFRPPTDQGLGLRPKLGQNGAKLTIMPNYDTVGIPGSIGGLIKVFSSDYVASQIDYQDLGVYYKFDQVNDKGVHNTGQFIFNVKAGFGGKYENTLADLAFTAQDGNIKFGKIVYENPSSGAKWGFLYIGSAQPSIAQSSSGALGIESTRGIAIKNTDRFFNGIRIYGYGNDLDHARISMAGNGSQLEIVKNANDLTKPIIALTDTDLTVTKVNFTVGGGIVSQGRTNATSSSSVDSLGSSRLVLSSGGSIDNIIGVDGQQLFVLNTNSSPAILKHGTGNMRFESNADITLNQYAGAWLINVNGTWYKSK